MSGPHRSARVAEALAWRGCKLDEVSGTTAGRVEGVLIDPASGEPVWLRVRTGLFGRDSVVPFEFAAGGAGRVWVAYPRGRIKSAPEIDSTGGIGPALELALCEHYGIPAGARRRAQLAGREDETLTAVPVESEAD